VISIVISENKCTEVSDMFWMSALAILVCFFIIKTVCSLFTLYELLLCVVLFLYCPYKIKVEEQVQYKQ
jgi:hypothetical protein